MFEVTVKTLDGKSTVFQIEDENLTVTAFKDMIATELEIPFESQRLIFQGKVLVDERKLKECGVEAKTIHLVPRPPPLTDAGPSSNSAGDDSAPTSTQVPTWLTGGSFQRVAENITQGIISGLRDLGRPADVAYRTNSDGHVDIRVSVPVVGYRDSHFRRLRRHAHALLNSVEGSGQRLNQAASVPSEGEGPRQTQAATTEPPAAELPSNNSPATSRPSTSSSSSTQNVTFSRLAGMLSEQRRLWRRMQPHLNQWENMLRNEHEAQTPRAADATETPQEPAESMDATESVPQPEWSQRYFNQMSSLIHMNAHMLHLISDFAVGNVGPDRPTTESVQSAPAESGTEQATTTTTSTLATPTHQPAVRQRRVVITPEGETPMMHAHINIEPTAIAIANPTNRPATAAALPPAVNDMENRRRSQSADPREPETGSRPAGRGWIPPATASRSAGGPHLQPLLPTATFMPMFNDLGREVVADFNQPSQNLVRSIVDMVGQTTSLLYSPHPEVQTAEQVQQPPQNRTAGPRVVNTSSSGSTGHMAAASAAAAAVLGNPLRSASQRNQVSNPMDPFLPCRSRHFAVFELAQNRYQTSTRRARLRRGRSAEPNLQSQHDSGAVSSDATDPASTDGSQQQAQHAAPSQPRLQSFTIPFGTPFPFSTDLGANITQISNQLNQMLSTQLPNLLSQQAAAGGVRGTPDVVGPFAWIINHPHGGGFQAVPPTVSAPTLHVNQTASRTPQPMQQLSGQTQLTQLPVAFFEGVLRTVWSFVSTAARSQLPPETTPPVNPDNWPSPASNAAADPSSLLHQPLLHLRRALSTALDTNEPNFSRRLDVLRQPFRGLLPQPPLTFDQGRNVTRDSLTSGLLAGVETDSNTTGVEGDLVTWMQRLEVGQQQQLPVDLRRSLFNFLSHRVMGHVSLWYHSPTDTGFGNLVELTLSNQMDDLLGFMDLLAQETIARLGLRPRTPDPQIGTNGRIETFGHSMSYEPLLQHLRAFAHAVEATEDRHVVSLAQSALSASLIRHCNRTAASLSRFTTPSARGLLEYRSPSGLAQQRQPSPSGMAVDTSSAVTPTSSDEVSVTTEPKAKMETAYDSDVSDAYVDATEDVPMASSSTSAIRTPPVPATKPSTGLRPPLPFWKPEENPSRPTSMAESLAANPNSLWRAADAPDQPAPFTAGDVPSGVPPEWVQIVAADVARMTRDRPGHSQASSPATTSAEECEELAMNMDPSLCRLSDAYIAGMPAKRRRVMLEKKRSLARPTEELFSNILIEATLPPGSGAAEHGRETVDAPEAAAVSALQPDPEVTEAFRKFVSERLTQRLTGDPDYEGGAHHSAARETFGKK